MADDPAESMEKNASGDYHSWSYVRLVEVIAKPEKWDFDPQSASPSSISNLAYLFSLIKAQLDTVNTYIQPWITRVLGESGTWQGDAADEFKGVIKEFQDKIDSFLDPLNGPPGYTNTLYAAATALTNLENSYANAMGNVASGVWWEYYWYQQWRIQYYYANKTFWNNVKEPPTIRRPTKDNTETGDWDLDADPHYAPYRNIFRTAMIGALDTYKSALTYHTQDLPAPKGGSAGNGKGSGGSSYNDQKKKIDKQEKDAEAKVKKAQDDANEAIKTQQDDFRQQQKEQQDQLKQQQNEAKSQAKQQQDQLKQQQKEQQDQLKQQQNEAKGQAKQQQDQLKQQQQQELQQRQDQQKQLQDQQNQAQQQAKDQLGQLNQQHMNQLGLGPGGIGAPGSGPMDLPDYLNPGKNKFLSPDAQGSLKVGPNGEILDANGNQYVGPDGTKLHVGANGQVVDEKGKPYLGPDGSPLHVNNDGTVVDANGVPYSGNGKDPYNLDSYIGNFTPIPPPTPPMPKGWKPGDPVPEPEPGSIKIPDFKPLGSGTGKGPGLGSSIGLPGGKGSIEPSSRGLNSLYGDDPAFGQSSRSGRAGGIGAVEEEVNPYATKSMLTAEQQAAQQSRPYGGGMPMSPMAPHGGGQQGGHDEQSTWLQEDNPEVWGVDPDVAPTFLDGTIC